ncbi:serine/threonine protein kinase, CMGC, dual-specificity [Castilleja foliolosa]|uniref:Serine/threonine protein kinase, CMGC, dual-specificity n=1 Tax=Castilleja foliolosa TaxID=1961234 RepID=A0ABD3EQV3_9LAMI
MAVFFAISMIIIIIIIIIIIMMAGVMSADSSNPGVVIVQERKGKLPKCTQGVECSIPSIYCCNQTVSGIFPADQFDKLFSMRNNPQCHAISFWDYTSFITAASLYEPFGFGTTGGRQSQLRELAAFFAHAGALTSCGNMVSPGGPLAWGLCFYKEMSPLPCTKYCDEDVNYEYKCVPGVCYYGRGAIPIYGNVMYGMAGKALKVDLLNHPEYIEQNATLAFEVAMWMWMTRLDKKVPSAHEAFLGAQKWKPTKDDTLAKRYPGFGLTMNIMYGNAICGKGDNDNMNSIISHYQYYLDLMGVGRENAENHEHLTCAEQHAFPRATIHHLGLSNAI